MTRRENTGTAGTTLFAPVLSIGTGLLAFVVLILMAPTLAAGVMDAQPAMSATSQWNRTANPDLIDGVQQWTTGIQVLSVVVLIISVTIGLYYLRLMG